MAKSTTQCNCLAGTAVIDANGNCGCINDYHYNPNADTVQSTVKGTVSIYQPQGMQTVANAVSGFNLVEWIKAHKWMVAVGAALLVFFYFRGSGFNSREVVSTTKYGGGKR